MAAAVAYLRVSTGKQGASGLGIEAQRETVRSWARAKGYTITAEFVEAESGRKSERPELARAKQHAMRYGCTLVVAKLDRLTRDPDFLRTVLVPKLRIAFCDLPEIDGPMGKFVVRQMADIAELEAGLISQRTKAALAAAKARGVRLGNPNGAAALLRYHRERMEAGTPHKGTQAAVAKAAQGANDAAAAIQEAQAAGFTSQREIAAELNRRGAATPRGKRWHQTSVRRVLERTGAA